MIYLINNSYLETISKHKDIIDTYDIILIWNNNEFVIITKEIYEFILNNKIYDDISIIPYTPITEHNMLRLLYDLYLYKYPSQDVLNILNVNSFFDKKIFELALKYDEVYILYLLSINGDTLPIQLPSIYQDLYNIAHNLVSEDSIDNKIIKIYNNYKLRNK